MEICSGHHHPPFLSLRFQILAHDLQIFRNYCLPVLVSWVKMGPSLAILAVVRQEESIKRKYFHKYKGRKATHAWARDSCLVSPGTAMTFWPAQGRAAKFLLMLFTPSPLSPLLWTAERSNLPTYSCPLCPHRHWHCTVKSNVTQHHILKVFIFLNTNKAILLKL